MDEVNITDERIEHIEKRHPWAFSKYGHYIPEALSSFHYMLKDDLPNTPAPNITGYGRIQKFDSFNVEGRRGPMEDLCAQQKDH